MDVAALTLVAAGTALATGLGALPVTALGARVVGWAPTLWGVAGGVMAVAAVVGLLSPAFEEADALVVLSGVAAGVIALRLADSAIRRRDMHLGLLDADASRRGLLVAGTLFAHSLPEGLAIGAAWASDSDVGVFVVIAIAIQNIPEGMVTALPLTQAGMSGPRVFWGAVATSAPQVPGALLAFWAVTAADGLLGFSFGLAAGAMLALVVLEIVPAAATRPRAGFAGATLGSITMILLANVLGA